MTSRVSKLSVLTVLGTTLAALGCGGTDAPPAGDHKVYFFGYVYDGATGARLTKADLTSMAIRYRDRTIGVKIEDDGRFVSTSPLPTWQDYTVSIDATGYRPFYSQNTGFEVPDSYWNNDMVATTGSTQTFEYDAYLFPTALQAPAVTFTINLQPDPTATTPQPKAAGTLRLRPTSAPSLESAPSGFRRWLNSNDLLTQTINKPFTDGTITLAAGEMVYGVTYQASVYDVEGYRPFVNSSTVLAGTDTTRSIDLSREAREPLQIIGTNAAFCTVPANGTSTTFGAQVTVTFNQDVELVPNTTYKEDIDNALYVGVNPNPSGFTCPLKAGPDANVQERGTKIEISGDVLTLSWNPSASWAPTDIGGNACTPPQAISMVQYTIPTSLQVQPPGGTVDERRSLYSLLGSSVLSCTTH